MKKSKYAAIALASTLALSTVVTAAPQAFDNNGITAQAAETDASTVKELIKELDVTATDYSAKVEAAKTAYDALDAAGKKKVSNAKLLNAHVAIKGNTALTDAITALPKADNTNFTDATLLYSVDSSSSAVKLVDAKDSKGNVLKDKKGVTIQRAVNDNVETEVAKLTTFQTAYAAMIANKDTKAPLAKVYKQYQAALKVATKQQQNINAKYQASSFVHAHDVLTGAKDVADYKVPVATIKGSKGKFKIDGDQYIIVAADGGYNVTDPTGATVKVTNGGSFKVINNDELDDSTASSDNSTLYDEYKVSTANGAIVLEKVEETITAAKGKANVLALDKSMAPSAYKALKAGTTKYSDQQIEMINALNNEYKKLNSSAKKVLSEDQVAKMKAYTAALKVQQALEKKLVSEDSKGVTKKITALKYSTDTAAYDKSITEAKAAYDALTNKYKKKVKSSTVATLKAHEDAIKVIKAINDLDTVSLLSAADAAAIDGKLVADIAKITGKDGSYTTLDKKAKGLVKNYKNIKAIEKLITTQKEYLKNNTKVKAFETALKAVTQSETVRTIDDQVKLGDTTYKISVDKASKAIILTTKNEAATETKVELNETNKSITGYLLENAKGKLTISTAATDANKVVPIYDFKGMSLDAFIAKDAKKYTADQKTAIEAAITAFEAANKDKIAKKHLNAADVTLVKKYQTALKQQVALEAKEEAKEYKDFTAAVGALKYSTEKGTGDNEAKSLYEVDALKALKTYQTLAGATAEEVGGEGAVAVVAKYEGAAKKLATTKAKLTDHVAASAVATSILALPALDEVKADTDVSKARTAFDKLSGTQKKLIAEGEKTLKAVEEQKTLLADLAAAKEIVKTAITVESTKAKDKKVILAAIKALDTKDTKNTVITALTESSIDITEAGVTVKLTAAEADKVTVTVNKNYDNELLAALNAKTVTVTPTGEKATKDEVLAAINELDTVKGLDTAAKALITTEKLTYTDGAASATVEISKTLTATIKVVSTK